MADVVSKKDIFKGILYMLKYVCLYSCLGIALLIKLKIN